MYIPVLVVVTKWGLQEEGASVTKGRGTQKPNRVCLILQHLQDFFLLLELNENQKMLCTGGRLA